MLASVEAALPRRVHAARHPEVAVFLDAIERRAPAEPAPAGMPAPRRAGPVAFDDGLFETGTVQQRRESGMLDDGA